MHSLVKLLREIFQNIGLIRRIANFNLKSQFSENYLGVIWNYLDPIIYISTYFVIFGLGLYSGTVAGQPYLVWLLAGIIPWYYIQGSFNKGLNSVSSQLNLLTKTKFPISVAPVVPMVQEFRRYIVLTGLFILILAIGFHDFPNVYWLQLVYAFAAMVATVLAHNFINSTIAVILPDYKRAVSAVFRLLFFTSGVIMNIDAKGLPFVISQTLKLFPFYYVIQSFRDAMVFHVWFWTKPSYMIFFWGLTLFMLLLGAVLHMKFRDQFIDKI
ncbi:ABC transporter permease [Weissella confusa]|uniref:ABC transporter permease n=1 Tax=Weissella confusa TaxID=1583 RepID=UPI0022E6C3E0|nr:ABC transporter permease [Weissella confusa]